jgi:ATP adenylyltransferase
MERLFSPWRLRYIQAAGSARGGGCVFCRAVRVVARDRAHLVLLRGRLNYIILNKYPYNNGHMMVVPFAHVPTLTGASPDTLHEMMDLATRCESALRTAYRPAGINLGMNLGRSAGAGIEGHFHLHVVPRWEGDTNFMSVIHGTRVIPEDLRVTYRRLRTLLLADAGLVSGRGDPRGRRRPRRSAGRR